jgi:hypothetical protein
MPLLASRKQADRSRWGVEERAQGPRDALKKSGRLAWQRFRVSCNHLRSFFGREKASAASASKDHRAGATELLCVEPAAALRAVTSQPMSWRARLYLWRPTCERDLWLTVEPIQEHAAALWAYVDQRLCGGALLHRTVATRAK